MQKLNGTPKPGNFLKWFDPRNRQSGSWAFILNRITAIGLTVYLYLHLVILSLLAQGPDAYDSFVKLAKTPIVLTGEFLVVAAGIIHGLNGLRIILNSFGIAVPQQKPLFYGLMAVAVVASLWFAYVMFTA